MVEKPLTILGKARNSRVIVELKNRRQYRGTLEGFDPHMNLVLRNAEEYYEDTLVRKHELTIVRGDNIVYISPP